MKRPYPECGREMIGWADNLVERVGDNCFSAEEAFDFVCMSAGLFRKLRVLAPEAFDSAVNDAAASMRAAELIYSKMQMKGGEK